jgi:hypothetical protein
MHFEDIVTLRMWIIYIYLILTKKFYCWKFILEIIKTSALLLKKKIKKIFKIKNVKIKLN